LKLTFPLLYGVDGPAVAETLGCWYEEKRNIIQPAAFIIDPERKLLNVTYSSGPIGRLRAQDALGLIGFYAKQKISVATVDPQRGWTENRAGN
jgi:alkyl hydroperoxide reductase subunit AhpC